VHLFSLATLFGVGRSYLLRTPYTVHLHLHLHSPTLGLPLPPTTHRLPHSQIICTVLYCTVLYYTVLYCTALRSILKLYRTEYEVRIRVLRTVNTPSQTHLLPFSDLSPLFPAELSFSSYYLPTYYCTCLYLFLLKLRYPPLLPILGLPFCQHQHHPSHPHIITSSHTSHTSSAASSSS
jgi:hypothetical protein